MSETLETRLFTSMIAFIQSTQRAADAALAAEAVSPAQFFLLRLLAQAPRRTQVDLATALGVSAANVSQLVSKLEQSRLVARVDEGKAKLVSLTPAGRALAARLGPEHESFLRGRFERLSLQERRALQALLTKLTGAASAPRAEPPPRAPRRARRGAE